MSRMFFWGVGCFLGGLLVFVLLFYSAWHGPERSLSVVFAIMAAIPVAGIAVIFGAVKTLQEELRETQRVIKAWQKSFDMVEERDAPSTQFKSDSPRRD